MNIALISSAINKTCTGLGDLNNTTIHQITSLKGFNNRQTLDLIFFDAQLGVNSVLQQIHAYQKHDKQAKWLIFNPQNIHQSLQFIKAGASGLLTHCQDKDTLPLCLQSIAKNQIYIDDSLAQILAIRQLKKILQPFHQLTPREFDVFCLIAEDYSIQTIATELTITEKTAFNCQTQLKKKLHLQNRQQIQDFAKINRLIL